MQPPPEGALGLWKSLVRDCDPKILLDLCTVWSVQVAVMEKPTRPKPLTIVEVARMGGQAYVRNTTPEQRSAQARKAVRARWAKRAQSLAERQATA